MKLSNLFNGYTATFATEVDAYYYLSIYIYTLNIKQVQNMR